MLEDITCLSQIAAAHPLRRQHIEAHSRRIRQPSEKPGGGGHQPHRRRLGRTQTTHHSCVDVLHDNGGELCHNSRPTELQRQGQLLTGGQRCTCAQQSQMIRFQGRTSKSLFSDFTIEMRFYQLRLRTFQDGIQPEAAPVTAKEHP